METLLSRQLQQAWLETQMRKQKGDLSSPSSTASSGVLSPFSQQHTPSSSTSSWDPGAEASPISAPLMQSQGLDEEAFHNPTLQSLDEEAFHDPALQYISKLLMEEDLHDPNLQSLDEEAYHEPTLQSFDEEAFHDPALHFISKMLMEEEDLDDRKCMMAECMSYFATAKGFSDILGSSEVSSLPCLNESERLRVSGQAFKDFMSKEEISDQNDSHFSGAPLNDSLFNFPSYEDDGNLADKGSHVRVSAQNDEKIRAKHAKDLLKFSIKEEYPLRVPAYEAEDLLNANGEEHQWIDDLFVNMDTVDLEQYAPAGVVPSPQASFLGHSDSSGSSYLSSQLSFDSSSHVDIHEQDPLFKLDSISPISVLAGSPSLGFSWNSTKVQHKSNGNAILGANGRWSHGKFTRSASDTTNTIPPSKTSLANSNSRFKRAASEIYASAASDNINSFSSGSNGVDLDSMEEERVSFVRNKDLNAEKYASILNDGLGAMRKGMFCKSSPASAREDVGKPTIIVTTVADLKGLLISCAQAVASNNIRRAHEILQEIRQDASPYGSGLQRLAHYFAEGLVARLSGTGDRLYSVFTNNSPSAAKMLKAHHLFVEVCPFLKVSHYFANRAIIEAAKGASRLHIIDYGILYGIQWPYLISALAERKGGPPVLRITGIDFPQPGMLHAERVEMTGKRLAEYAKTYGVPFEYHAIASSWETIQPSSLNLKPDEVVIVNCMHRLHHLLDETVLASNPRKTVLSKIREINPKIFVHGAKNGNYNAPFFMSRFKEALASFSGFFDLLETVIKSDSQERMMFERSILGRNILNVVACEGPERVERPETYRQWQNRTLRAGFDPIPLDRNVLRESQAIVKCGYNKNFTVDEDGSWMVVSWKGKVADALSLWKPALANSH